MISPGEAIRIVFRHVRPLVAARAELAAAEGCCLAEDVRADRDMPPCDRSAMDGFAVRSADVRHPGAVLRLAGEVAAGSPERPRVRRGVCVRVLTGARMPPGADAVVQVEHTAEADGWVTFLYPALAGRNLRRRGEEAAKGAPLLEEGTVLGPAQVGICAAAGRDFVRVHPPPRVLVLCTGDELRPAGKAKPHELRDSNGPSLLSALHRAGCTEVRHRIVEDDLPAIVTALRAAARWAELIVITGGVSVGSHDYVPEALARLGATVRFHGVAMKPGRPLAYATLPEARKGKTGEGDLVHIFGLPGNPVSVLTGFYEFVLPALRRMGGWPQALCRPVVQVPLAKAVQRESDRVRFMLARLAWTPEGPTAVPIVSRGSADLVAAGAATGVVVVPQGADGLPAGEIVEFRPWEGLP